MNSREHKAYMRRMGDDFYETVLDVAEEHYVTLEGLYIQYGERPFWHDLTRDLNESQEFDGSNCELKDLTERKVKHLVKRHFGHLLGVYQLRMERNTAKPRSAVK